MAGFPRMHDQPHLRQPPRGLTQRTCRQAAPVAQAPLGIHRGDLQIPLQPVVLEPIVADEDVAAKLPHQTQPRGDAVGPGDDRATGTPGQQHRLVAQRDRVRVRVHQVRPVPGLAAVAAGQDAGAPPLGHQSLRQP